MGHESDERGEIDVGGAFCGSLERNWGGGKGDGNKSGGGFWDVQRVVLCATAVSRLA